MKLRSHQMKPSTSRGVAKGGMMGQLEATATGAVVALLIATGCCGCRRDEPAPTPLSSVVQPEHKPERLVFPAELRVEDDTVNEFVDRAMRTIAQGEYEPFRALWSVRRDPPSSADFEKGWQAVRSIRVLALEKVVIAAKSDQRTTAPTEGAPSGDAPPGDASRAPEVEHSYALLAEIALDPKSPATRGEPIRDIVLVMIREQGEWRLVRAPKALSNWLLERAGKSRNRADLPAPAPTGG